MARKNLPLLSLIMDPQREFLPASLIYLQLLIRLAFEPRYQTVIDGIYTIPLSPYPPIPLYPYTLIPLYPIPEDELEESLIPMLYQLRVHLQDRHLQ